MTFCYSPWTNIDISPTGDITPCCKFQKKYYTEQFNIQTSSFAEYVNSDLVNGIKHEFQQGTWPAGCERCRNEESHGIKSKRQLDYTRWREHYNLYDLASNKFLTTSIAFGNTCNLKCITCGPYSSSRWQKEYHDLYGKNIPHFKFYKKNFVQNFVAQAPDIIHLDIPGGEPFLSGVDEQKDLLSYYISTGQSKNVTLHYTTNAQVFPAGDWWQLWSQFKEVDIQLSIDGIGARYEYIRHPANWSTLIDNLDRYLLVQDSHIRLSVSHTVSAYNIYYLDEFFKWCYSLGLPHPWLGRVHTPQHMCPEVWSNDARTAIIEKLQTSKYPDVLTWANMMSTADESKLFDKFKYKLHAHDQYRGINFKNIFPELADYI